MNQFLKGVWLIIIILLALVIVLALMVRESDAVVSIHQHHPRTSVEEVHLSLLQVVNSALTERYSSLEERFVDATFNGVWVTHPIKRISGYTTSPDETWGDPEIPFLEQYRVVPGNTVAVSHDLRYLLGKWIIYNGTMLFVNDLMNVRYEMSIDLVFETKEEAFIHGVTSGVIVVVPDQFAPCSEYLRRE